MVTAGGSFKIQHRFQKPITCRVSCTAYSAFSFAAPSNTVILNAIYMLDSIQILSTNSILTGGSKHVFRHL